MEKINVVNYHVSMRCNYHCKFCYARVKVSTLSLPEQFRVCDAVKDFFDEQGVTDGRINFAGGEPLMYNEIYKLLQYCKSIGMKTSIITNASLLMETAINSLLMETAIKRLADCGVEMVGISVDSLQESTNMKLGRSTEGDNVLSLDELISICKSIKSNGMKLKINSCVTALNYSESIVPLLSAVECDRFKILKAQKIEEVNDLESFYSSDEQFKEFCDRHAVYSPIIEDDCDMENSYVIIYPDGRLLDNRGGQYHRVGSCINTKISLLLDRLPFNQISFDGRYKKV